jgi:hypothetical protein
VTRRIVNGMEQDVHCRYWRQRLCWTRRPRSTAWVKRFTNRRERREGKTETAQQLRDQA